MLAKAYTEDETLIGSMWKEVEKKYTSKKRYYHNLDHIASMLSMAEEKKDKVQKYELLLFAIWYHDIIYNVLRNDNEQRSARYAMRKLQGLGVKTEGQTLCKWWILSANAHQPKDDSDMDNRFLLDFDLAILGSPWSSYQDHIVKIRKEFGIYPDKVFKKGRKKSIERFLRREHLYFTAFYRDQYEVKARENLHRELQLL